MTRLWEDLLGAGKLEMTDFKTPVQGGNRYYVSLNVPVEFFAYDHANRPLEAMTPHPKSAMS